MSPKVDLSRVDLNLLVVFEAVLREQHVGRAAASLDLSPSAVSHGLNRLRRLLSDPLFLRTPKGVVPTARTQEVAPQIAEVLEGVRQVIAAGQPFDPATSARRFTVGVPDVEGTSVIPTLASVVGDVGPGIDLSVRTVMPNDALDELDAGRIDVAVTPYVVEVPLRFHLETLFEQQFVVAARDGHPFMRAPNLDAYCRQSHAVMSQSGDAWGFVDDALAKMGRSRRVALTLPSFLSILAVLEHTDLVAAAPRGIVERFADRLGLAWVEPPLGVESSTICAITTRAAMRDAGVAWMIELLRETFAAPGVSQPSQSESGQGSWSRADQPRTTAGGALPTHR